MNIQRDTEYRYGEFVQNPDYGKQVIRYKYVDLGLPSGTLWAKQNVGALSPTETGLYFAWGETQGYKPGERTFNNQSYDQNIRTKYVNVQNGAFMNYNYILDPEDDAATVNMGEGWCMPSLEQIQELNDSRYVTRTSVTNYNNSGVNGALFTSKSNGNTLFIPASGYLYVNNLTDANIMYFWSNKHNVESNSSTLYAICGYNKYLVSSYGVGSTTGGYDYTGRPVRGVKSGSNDTTRATFNTTLQAYGDGVSVNLDKEAATYNYTASYYGPSESEPYAPEDVSMRQFAFQDDPDDTMNDKRGFKLIYGAHPLAHTHEPIIITCKHYSNDNSSYTTETFTIPWKRTSEWDNVEIYDLRDLTPALPSLDVEVLDKYIVQSIQVGGFTISNEYGGEGGGD